MCSSDLAKSRYGYDWLLKHHGLEAEGTLEAGKFAGQAASRAGGQVGNDLVVEPAVELAGLERLGNDLGADTGRVAERDSDPPAHGLEQPDVRLGAEVFHPLILHLGALLLEQVALDLRTDFRQRLGMSGFDLFDKE